MLRTRSKRSKRHSEDHKNTTLFIYYLFVPLLFLFLFLFCFVFCFVLFLCLFFKQVHGVALTITVGAMQRGSTTFIATRNVEVIYCMCVCVCKCVCVCVCVCVCDIHSNKKCRGNILYVCMCMCVCECVCVCVCAVASGSSVAPCTQIRSCVHMASEKKVIWFWQLKSATNTSKCHQSALTFQNFPGRTPGPPARTSRLRRS